jgi:diaminopimelate decarboxylase
LGHTLKVGILEEFFEYRDNRLCCDGHSIEELAREIGAPFYLYSARCLQERYRRLDRAFAGVTHLICYALKANSQPALLRVLLAEGAGAEVVSGGELALALAVGFDPGKIVFSGVGKAEDEIEAGIRAGIRLFIVESGGELAALERLASQHRRKANVALRINPDVDAATHPHITTGLRTSKFGIEREAALALYRRREEFPHLNFNSIHAHIGSQITSLEPMSESARLLEDLCGELGRCGVTLDEVDWGGGLGITHGDQNEAPSFEEYAGLILPWLERSGLGLIIEPGRALVGPAGALVVRVLYVKEHYGRHLAVVGGGMTDLLRPALYDAYHRIVPIERRNENGIPIDVVGAVCESSDVFGRECRLGELKPGDLLAILDTGAYGYAMSSNYNLRPRPAEVVVEEDDYRVVRRAETREELVARELDEG